MEVNGDSEFDVGVEVEVEVEVEVGVKEGLFVGEGVFSSSLSMVKLTVWLLSIKYCVVPDLG